MWYTAIVQTSTRTAKAPATGKGDQTTTYFYNTIDNTHGVQSAGKAATRRTLRPVLAPATGNCGNGPEDSEHQRPALRIPEEENDNSRGRSHRRDGPIAADYQFDAFGGMAIHRR
jgi:hypothetical protein